MHVYIHTYHISQYIHTYIHTYIPRIMLSYLSIRWRVRGLFPHGRLRVVQAHCNEHEALQDNGQLWQCELAHLRAGSDVARFHSRGGPQRQVTGKCVCMYVCISAFKTLSLCMYVCMYVCIVSHDLYVCMYV